MSKHTHPWLVLVLLAALFAGPVAAGDGEDAEVPENKTTTEFTMGYQGSSTDDELLRVAEYDLVEPNGIIGLLWRSSPYDKNRVGLQFDRLDHKATTGAAELDLDRVVRFEAKLDAFLHRTDNDPVSNLQAISDIKTVRSTDLDFGVDYQIRNQIYDLKTEFQHPNVPGLSFRAGYWALEQDGNRQVLSTSHCESCHTVAQGREIERSTRETTAGIHFARGNVDLDYQISGRKFEEDASTPIAPFETALRPAPAGWTPSADNFLGLYDPANVPAAVPAPFDDRLWFQAVDAEVNSVPRVERLAHRFKARAGFDNGSALKFTVVQSTSENRSVGIEYDFTAYRGSYYTKLSKNLRMNVDARFEELENDDYAVNLAALFGGVPIEGYPVVGPTTFQDWRRGDLDDEPVGLAALNAQIEFENYLRQSALDRTTGRFGVDFLWRAMRRGSLRFGYAFKSVDRDNDFGKFGFDGSGALQEFTLDRKTESSTFKVAWNQRVTKRARFNADLRYTTTDNPYANVNGALRQFAGFRAADGEPIGQVPVPPGPRGTDSLQYYELHAFRIADVTNAPSDELQLRVRGRWAPKAAKWSVSGNARYKDRENDELDYTDWDQQSWGVGANLWVAGGSRFLFNVGADHAVQETDAEMIIPLMDG